MVGLIAHQQSLGIVSQSSSALKLEPGTEVSARVVSSSADNVMRLSVGKETLDVKASTPLPPGTEVTVKVTGTNSDPKIQIVAQGSGSGSAPGSGGGGAGSGGNTAGTVPQTPAPTPSTPAAAASTSSGSGNAAVLPQTTQGTSVPLTGAPVSTTALFDATGAVAKPQGVQAQLQTTLLTTTAGSSGQVPGQTGAQTTSQVPAQASAIATGAAQAPAGPAGTAANTVGAIPNPQLGAVSGAQGGAGGVPVQATTTQAASGAAPQAAGSVAATPGSQTAAQAPAQNLSQGVTQNPVQGQVQTQGSAQLPAQGGGVSGAGTQTAGQTTVVNPGTIAGQGAANVGTASGGNVQGTAGMGQGVPPASGQASTQVPGLSALGAGQPASQQAGQVAGHAPGQTGGQTAGQASVQASSHTSAQAAPAHLAGVVSERLGSAYAAFRGQGGLATNPAAEGGVAGAQSAAMNASLNGGKLPVSPQLQQMSEVLKGGLERQQASIGAVFAQASQVLSAQSGQGASVPASVKQVLQQMMGLRLGGGGASTVNGEAIKQAVTASGLMREAASQMSPAQLGASGDLKSLLINLKSLLEGMGVKPSGEKSFTKPSNPSLTGGARGQPPTALGFGMGDDGPQMLGRLLQQADSALSRIRLTQMASRGLIGDDVAPQVGRAMDTVVELPLAFGGQTAVMQMQVGRDPNHGDGDDPDEAGWRLRFGMELSATGPLEAAVSLRGGSTFVSLWLEREETYQMLGAQRDSIEAAFAHAGLDLQELRFVRGLPIRPKSQAGSRLDRQS
ncbi:MAG: flagellar hook-length control protein FliK [Rhodobacteraceae bacterium]|nr:flagellar hook-length control protein FliK [Paracoccaceae bacterium]